MAWLTIVTGLVRGRGETVEWIDCHVRHWWLKLVEIPSFNFQISRTKEDGEMTAGSERKKMGLQ